MSKLPSPRTARTLPCHAQQLLISVEMGTGSESLVYTPGCIWDVSGVQISEPQDLRSQIGP